MSRARLDLPRKLPTQARARATVDAILRATAHILRTQGWDACNTNAVAKRAGVSIGSLYQYFPSKEALVAALTEQHAQASLAVLVDAIARAPTEPRSVDETVRHYIRAMVRLHAADPKLHRVLVEQVPQLRGGRAVLQRVSQESARLVRGWLETQRAQLRAVDLDVATYVLVTSVEAVTHLQVLRRPERLDEDLLVAELTELVLGYLGVGRARGRARR
ncbi:MAG: TetR/AcrR family transcriptional regulator [Myxococcota bacterium]